MKPSVDVASFEGLAEEKTTKYQPYMKKIRFVGVLHEVLPQSSPIKNVNVQSAYGVFVLHYLLIYDKTVIVF